MEEEIQPPWWRTPLQVLGIGLGLVLLAAVSMGLIFLVARFVDAISMPATEVASPPPAHEQNARTRVPSPYGPVPWPDSPGRKPAVSIGIGDSMRMLGGGRASGGGGGAGSPAQARPPSVPTGVSVEEYRAAVEGGKKLYLPNPQGECDLNTAKSADALEGCLARQAAR
jgi:hypothetical protein